MIRYLLPLVNICCIFFLVICNGRCIRFIAGDSLVQTSHNFEALCKFTLKSSAELLGEHNARRLFTNV